MPDTTIAKLSDEQTVSPPAAPSEAASAESASGTAQDNATDGSAAESEEAFNRLREDLRSMYQPVGEFEELIVTEVARLTLLKVSVYRQYGATRDVSRSYADFEK